EKNGDRPPLKAILVPATGVPTEGALADLLEDEARLRDSTIVLPPDAGGLDQRGMLQAPEAKKDPTHVRDVADIPPAPKETEVPRLRVLLTWKAGEERWSARRLGWDDDNNLDRAVAEARNYRDAAARVLRQFQRMAQKALLVVTRDEEDDGPIKVL